MFQFQKSLLDALGLLALFGSRQCSQRQRVSKSNILVTSVRPSVLHLLPRNGGHPPAAVASVPDVNGLLGLFELRNDVFYVVGSNLTTTNNSNGVWRVDLRDLETSRYGTIARPADVSLVQRIPSVLQLNGMTRLAAADDDADNLLISDSGAGSIVRLNVEEGPGRSKRSSRTPTWFPCRPGPTSVYMGIRIRENELLYVSLDRRHLQRRADSCPKRFGYQSGFQRFVRRRLCAVEGW
ncbi:hypothetical protein Cob_v009409 [Colletotrichum orbiculare MAFF 240422]|uniref:Uncharacterized protein n=1 Tax=Colletotrichum orbiculare (strain 104-T / ATCC 96160 / CBS 514.97 / LARS 414 / MAFF 240422) TaxID=1213857 RepID=A0A484FHS5_COLOR|nr:hypothetical protein Cob_v009409 [Colletotrichum orbiculare MAFF 240422]